jgi:hypothetical protein
LSLGELSVIRDRGCVKSLRQDVGTSDAGG